MSTDEDAFIRWLERKARPAAMRSETAELERRWAEFGLKWIRRLMEEKAHEFAQPRLPEEPTPEALAAMRATYPGCYSPAQVAYEGYRALRAHLTKPPKPTMYRVRGPNGIDFTCQGPVSISEVPHE